MPRPLAFAAFLLGFTSLLIQIVVARELLTSFLGNEISIAIILLVWLGFVALGSAVGGRVMRAEASAASALPWLQLTTALVLIPAVWVAQAGGGVGRFPGQVVGPGTMALLAAASLALPCVLLGATFAALCRAAEGDSADFHIAKVYALEAGGAVVAGLLFHFRLADHFGSAHSALIAAGVNAAAATCMWRSRELRALAAVVGWCVGTAVVLVLLLLPPGLHGLDGPGLGRRWRGMTVLAETNSRYGNVAVVDVGSIVFYEAGLPVFSTDDAAANEAAVHPAMLMHPEPTRVLMIGGGLGGGIEEVLKHEPAVLNYVELDRKLVDLAREHVPGGVAEAADILYIDGRAHVREQAAITREKQLYDVVLVLTPDPSTTSLSRFYTVEFFEDLRGVLAPGGIACIGLTAAQAKLSGPRQYLHATVYRALKETFPHVILIPGEYTQYVASPAQIGEQAKPHLLAERLVERSIETAFVNEAWLDFALGELPREMLEGSLREAGDVPANRDSRPLAAHYWLRMWLAEVAPGVAGALDAAPGLARLTWVLVPVSLGLALLFRRSRRLPQVGASVCIWGTGFLEMGAQLALVMAYQAVAGYLYHHIGILMALFMLGLAVGAMVGKRLAGNGARRMLLGAVALQAASAACLPLLLTVARSAGPLVGVVFAGGACWMGLMGGLNFPLAVAVTAGPSGDAARAASRLYALDLLGAAAGAVLIGAIAIPAVGIVTSCRILAAILLAALAPLAVGRWGRGGG